MKLSIGSDHPTAKPFRSCQEEHGFRTLPHRLSGSSDLLGFRHNFVFYNELQIR